MQFSQILLCVAGASIFGWILGYYQAPTLVTGLITGFTSERWMVMILIVLLFLMLGTFMDAVPAILIFVPIIQPAAIAVGVHPVHLGIVVVMTLALGLLTPPYGLCALTACAVARIPVLSIVRLLGVMMISLAVVVLACALVPETVLGLPRLLVPNWI